jgi:hypothetical protein
MLNDEPLASAERALSFTSGAGCLATTDRFAVLCGRREGFLSGRIAVVMGMLLEK